MLAHSRAISQLVTVVTVTLLYAAAFVVMVNAIKEFELYTKSNVSTVDGKKLLA